ncbi:hypothetical protein CDLVIII_1310 [Clostridium sp. DL-VIII]|uniref:hypothetical protein n=1 Tax=Clostridium sp. DL-VIII TaxID=641107 RepID=UPI00023AF7AD|nr:hypothetical protein [Clostridium sp. DL-VIII]EHI98009.1 hypothetical protein CDLVIII_1310 [Clostridium sp. DL-VIII]
MKKEILKEQLTDKNLIQFQELMMDIGKLSYEKRMAVSAYVQGILVGMDMSKLN